MLKIRLLQAVCTVAMLGAVPAFAQSNTQPPAAAAPGAQQASPDHSNMSPSADKTGMAPDEKDGLGMHGQKMTHRSAMMHRGHAMHASSKTDSSQDSEIDRLNSQSYQAAQKGQAFSANDSGSMMKSNASGGMSGNGMSGNGMSGSGMSGNGTSGSSMSGNGMSGGSMSGGHPAASGTAGTSGNK